MQKNRRERKKLASDEFIEKERKRQKNITSKLPNLKRTS